MADDAVVTCVRCGNRRDARVPAAEALAWVAERERGTVRWLCPACARRHVRDMESKLPSEYW